MATDAERVMARGIEVVLADGNSYRLKIDLESVELLEDEWGGLADFIDLFNESLTKGLKSKRGKLARTAVQAGLLHLGIAPADASKLVVPRMLVPPSALMFAIRDALNEALLEPSEQSAGKSSAEESASPGPSSTTSAPSDLGVLTAVGAA